MGTFGHFEPVAMSSQLPFFKELCLVILIMSTSFSIALGGVVQISGPSRQFSSISTIGTKVLNCDDCLLNITLPFSYSLGSLKVSSLAASSNGVINLLTSEKNNGCCAPVPIQPNSSTVSRIAVLQSDLTPNLNGSIFLYCAGSSCVVSYEAVSMKANQSTFLSAQVEIFSSGAVELRYGNVTSIPSSFVGGVQDESQGIRAPITFAGCSTLGLCVAGQPYPALQGLRFTWVDDSVNVSALKPFVDQETSRAISSEASLGVLVSNVQSNLLTEFSNAKITLLPALTAIQSEISRSMSAESSIASSIAPTMSQALSNIQSIKLNLATETSTVLTAINDEYVRGNDAEFIIQQNFDYLQYTIYTISADLSASLSLIVVQEKSDKLRALSAEASLSGSISAQAKQSMSREQSLGLSIIMEISRALGYEAQLSTALVSDRSSAVYSSISLATSLIMWNQTVQGQVAAVSLGLQQEISRSISVEASFSMRIAITKSTVDSAVGQGQSQANNVLITLTAEVSRATAADNVQTSSLWQINSTLLVGLAAETARALAAEGALQANANSLANSEINRAMAAEGSIAVSISTAFGGEKQRAMAVEMSLQISTNILSSAVVSEISRAAVDASSMKASISSLTGQQATQLSTSSVSRASINASLQTSASITANTINAIEGSLRSSQLSFVQVFTASIASGESSLSQAISFEISRSQDAESKLAQQLWNFTVGLQGAADTLSTSVQSQFATSGNIQTSLSMSLSNEVSQRTSFETYISTALSQEASTAMYNALSLSTAVSSQNSNQVSQFSRLDQVDASLAMSLQKNNDAQLASIALESSRASVIELSIGQALIQSVLSANVSEVALASALSNEIMRATNSELSIAVVSALTGAQETSRALATEVSLSTAFVSSQNQLNASLQETNAALRLAEEQKMANISLALQLEQTRRLRSESSLAQQLSQTNSGLATETSRAWAIETSLSMNQLVGFNIAAVEASQAQQYSLQTLTVYASSAVAVESSSSRESANRFSDIVTNITSFHNQISSSLSAAQAASSSALSAETSRATASEHDLNNGLNAEYSRATGVEASLSASLQMWRNSAAQDSNRTAGLVASIAAGLASEIARAGTSENAVSSNLTQFANEMSKALSALNVTLSQEEQAIRLSLWRSAMTEQSRALSIENSLSSTFSDLVADLALQKEQQLGALQSNLSSLMSAAQMQQSVNINKEASLSLSIQQLSQTEVSHALAVNTSLDTLAQAQTGGFSNLGDLLNQEISASNQQTSQLTANIADLSSQTNTNLTLETMRATAVENSVGRALTVQQSNAATFSTLILSQISSAVGTEVSTALLYGHEMSISRDIENNTAVLLQQEITRATGMELSLGMGLSLEASNAQGSIAGEGSRAQSTEMQLQSTLQTINSTLTSGLNVEKSAARATETMIATALSAQVVQSLTAQTGILNNISNVLSTSNQAASSLVSQLNAETLRALQAETSIWSTLSTVNVSISSDVSNERARAMQVEQNIASMIDLETNRSLSAQQQLVNLSSVSFVNLSNVAMILASQLSIEVSRAMWSEQQLTNSSTETISMLSFALNSSQFSNLQYISDQELAIKDNITSLTNQLSTTITQAKANQNSAASQSAFVRQFLALRPQTSNVAWVVSNPSATCMQCNMDSITICTTAAADSLQASFDYKVFLLKTYPNQFYLPPGQNSTFIQVSSIQSISIQPPSLSYTNLSCLDLQVSLVPTPTAQPKVNRRDLSNTTQPLSNITETDLLSEVQTFFLTNTTSLTWDLVPIGSGAVVGASASSSATTDCKLSTANIVLIVWNIILTLLIIFFAYHICRRNSLSRLMPASQELRFSESDERRLNQLEKGDGPFNLFSARKSSSSKNVSKGQPLLLVHHKSSSSDPYQVEPTSPDSLVFSPSMFSPNYQNEAGVITETEVDALGTPLAMSSFGGQQQQQQQQQQQNKEESGNTESNEAGLQEGEHETSNESYLTIPTNDVEYSKSGSRHGDQQEPSKLEEEAMATAYYSEEHLYASETGPESEQAQPEPHYHAVTLVNPTTAANPTPSQPVYALASQRSAATVAHEPAEDGAEKSVYDQAMHTFYSVLDTTESHYEQPGSQGSAAPASSLSLFNQATNVVDPAPEQQHPHQTQQQAWTELSTAIEVQQLEQPNTLPEQPNTLPEQPNTLPEAWADFPPLALQLLSGLPGPDDQFSGGLTTAESGKHQQPEASDVIDMQIPGAVDSTDEEDGQARKVGYIYSDDGLVHETTTTTIAADIYPPPSLDVGDYYGAGLEGLD